MDMRLWSMAVTMFMLAHMHLKYRGMVGHINARREMLEKPELNTVPAKSTTHRASERIPKSHYRQMHFRKVARISAGNLAGDSSGFLMRKFITRFSVRKDSHTLKKGRYKLHIIIGIRARVMLDHTITHAYRADAPVMEDVPIGMIDAPYGYVGNACFGAACLHAKYATRYLKWAAPPS